MDGMDQQHIDQQLLGHSDRRGMELQEVTNAMVRLYKELFGRGPTKARSNYAGPDTLLVTIENSMMAAERNMLGWMSTSGCGRYACSFSTPPSANS
jgi:hypothetical protein